MMLPLSRPLCVLLAAGFAALASSCASPIQTAQASGERPTTAVATFGGGAAGQDPARASGTARTAGDGEGEESAAEKERAARKRAAELAEKEHELAMARIELRLAAMKSEDEAVDARLAVRRAEAEVQEAERALVAYRDVEAPLARGRSALTLDRARGRAEDSQAELKELEAMYAEEEFALSTKELVIRRGRRSLEHAQRSLALEEIESTHQSEHEIPAKTRGLERALEKATAGLESARRALERGELEREMRMAKARFRVGELERELGELRAEAEQVASGEAASGEAPSGESGGAEDPGAAGPREERR